MTIYTPKIASGAGQPISNTTSSTWMFTKESVKEGFRNGPINSLIRYSDAIQAVNNDDSPVISKEEADKVLNEIGVNNIDIPSYGVTQSYLDFVKSATANRAKSQTIINSERGGFLRSTIGFAAQLAGDMADPGNLVLAFMPIAKSATATTNLGKFGQRFTQGAKIGASQAAIVAPINMEANAAEGADYSLSDVGLNIAFGGIAGGLLNAGGGFIGDHVKARLGKVKASLDESSPSDGMGARDISQDASDVHNYAYKKAFNEALNEHKSNSDIFGKIKSGAIPDNIASKINSRAKEIENNLSLNKVTSGIRNATNEINNAHWKVREQSIRAAIAQAYEGKLPEVEPFFDLSNPELRYSAMQKIANYDGFIPEPESIRASEDAQVQYARSNKTTELQSAIDDFNFEIEKINQKTSDIESPSIRDAVSNIEKEVNDNSLIDGIRAFAGCIIRRGL